MEKTKRRALLCAAGCILCAFLAGSTNTSLNLFLTSLCEDLGCTATQASYIFTFSSCCGMVVSFMGGTLLSKFHPKWLCCAGGICIGGIFLGVAFSHSIYIIWALSFFYGAGNMMCCTLLYQTLITGWFKTGASFLMSVSMCVSNGLGALLSPVTANLVTNLGYRRTALLYAMIFAGGLILVGLLTLSRLPSAYGVEPVELSIGRKKTQSKASSGQISVEREEVPTKELLKRPVFYVILGVPALINFCLTMYFYNMSYVYISKGMELVQASYFISLAQASGLVLNFTFGMLSERLGKERAFTLYFTLGIVGMLSAAFLNGWIGAVALALLINAAQCCFQYAPLFAHTFFGGKTAAKMIGWANAFVSVLCMFAAPVGIFLSNLAGGSFTIVFLAFAAVYVIAILGTRFLSAQKVKVQA